MGEVNGQIELIYFHKKLAIISGLGTESRGYVLNNHTWLIDILSGGTYTASFRKLTYSL